jgi:OOP family OmpA-OmpF porin
MFVSNQATLLASAQTKLDQISAALVSSSDTTDSILIEGYTDSLGGDAHNIALSQRRAQAVRDYIVSRGYPTEKIRSTGMGKANPIASNANAEGRANNRRVEIIIAPSK